MNYLGLVVIIFVLFVQNAIPQVPTENQIHTSDAQLNQVYKELRSKLNEQQKAELKKSQLDWIKKRDAFVTNNPQNPQNALWQATLQRTSELRQIIQSQSVEGKANPVEKITMEWMKSEFLPQSRIEVAGNENAIPILRPPLSPKGDLSFGMIDESRHIIITVENIRMLNWMHESTVRVWNLQTGRLQAVLSIPSGIVNAAYSPKTENILLITGPLHGKDLAEPFCYQINVNAIRGDCRLVTESKIEANSFGIDKDACLDWVVHIHKITELSQSKSFVLNKSGTLISKDSWANIYTLGHNDSLVAPVAIAVSPNGRYLALGSLNGYWTFCPYTLKAEYYQVDWPVKIDRNYPRRTFAFWSVDDEMIVRAKVSKDGESEYNCVLAAPNAEITPCFPNKSNLETLPVFGSEKIELNYEYQGALDPPAISIINPNGNYTYISSPAPHHIPRLSAGYSEQQKIFAVSIRGSGPSLGDYWGQILILNQNMQVLSNWDDEMLLGIEFITFLEDNNCVLTSSRNGSIATIDYQLRKEISRVHINGGNGVRQDFPSDKRARFICSANEDGGVSLIQRNSDNSLEIKSQLFAFTNGGWCIKELLSGYYIANAVPLSCLSFSLGDSIHPFEQFDLRLNRPDIVLERLGAPDEAIAIAKQLREKRLKRMGVTEEMLQPDFHLPEIEIVGDLPSSTAASDLVLKIKASDSKYPLDRLRLYVNNVPVNGKEGELLRDAKSQTLERTIPIKLAAGRNKIQVSVLNSAGAESLYANAEVTCTANRPKPTLYAVAMGVSEYSNPEWNLKYAAKDANDILARIRSKSGSSYGEVKELLLTDREVTKESLGKIRKFLSKATVDDTVLMFVAGHGLLDSKYDYYFGTSDIDFDNPSRQGIAFEEFDDLLAELPCLKKSLLIDTCHAGELDEDEKKILASATGTSAPLPAGQGIAVRSVGTRGMTIKPIEGARGKSEWYDRLQGLFVDLRRGSGSTILSSSAGAEYALESSEQKNGLFTYAVLEALDGKEGSDANKDGSVTMSELAEYVKNRVATLTNNKQSPNVRRVNLESDFTVASKSPLEPTFSKPSIGNFIK